MDKQALIALGWQVTRPNGYFFQADRGNQEEIVNGFITEAEAWAAIAEHIDEALTETPAHGAEKETA